MFACSTYIHVCLENHPLSSEVFHNICVHVHVGTTGAAYWWGGSAWLRNEETRTAQQETTTWGAEVKYMYHPVRGGSLPLNNDFCSMFVLMLHFLCTYMYIRVYAIMGRLEALYTIHSSHCSSPNYKLYCNMNSYIWQVSTWAAFRKVGGLH